jgi:hypothetical protein
MNATDVMVANVVTVAATDNIAVQAIGSRWA